MKSKGEVVAEERSIAPAPLELIFSVFAFVKVFPLIVTGFSPQMLPLVLLNVSAGPLTQPQDTVKGAPVVEHRDAFLTVIEWLPLATPLKEAAVWKDPPSRLYSSPVPVGEVMLTTAFPTPASQFTS